MDGEIVVRGEGEACAIPDRAVVRVSLDGEGTNREDAYAAAAQLANAVDAALEAAGDAIERALTTGVVVQPKTRWHKGETTRTGWTATRSSVVTIVDLDQVGSLIAALSAAGASVAGPTWELDAKHSAYDAARSDAAADARRRAEAYAAALGVRLGLLAWASEPGLRHGSSPGGVMMTRPMSAGAAMPPDGEVIAVAVEEITVRAALEVGYTVLHD